MVNQTLYGIVPNRGKAEAVIQALIDSGVKPQDISFLSSQNLEFQEFNNRRSALEASRNWRTEERVTDYPAGTQTPEKTRGKGANRGQDKGGLGTEKHSKAPEGTTTGALTGGIIGGTLGLLAGIGALAIPGLGPFIAAGPLMATLAGIGAGGTLGGIVGALVGAGIPEYEAKRYENRLKQGGILIAIRAMSDDQTKLLKDLLQKNGVEDVTTSSEAAASKNHKK